MRLAVLCAVLCAVVTAVLGTAGCVVQVPGTPHPADAVFTDAQGRFAIVPPPGWTVDTSGAQNTAVFFADPRPSESAEGRFRANINVIVVPARADLPGTVVRARRELTALTDYQPTADEPVTLPDGSRAHLLGGSFRDPQSGMALRNVQLLTVGDAETVVATGTALADTWAGYEPVFETSLRSLTVPT
jgi:hypothetical protein